MTIAEIAARAGVSKTAVSRYLNDGYVSAEKREAIRVVIEQTGYVPSRQAQLLRTGRSRLVGVILPTITSESMGRVVHGISHALASSDFQMLLANTENDEKKELEYLEVFRKGRVDGILLVATMITPAHRRAIQSCQVPVVVLGQYSAKSCCIYHDDEGAARALTEKMLAAGRRHIAYIGVTPRDRAAGLARRTGVQAALTAAGVPWMEELALQSDFSMQGGATACNKLLAKGLDFDGLFCATDSIAVGAMQALQAAGRSVPDDVAVVGVGDSKLGQLLHPRLTTAHYYHEKCGEEGSRMLLSMMEGEPATIQRLCLGYELIDGETVPERIRGGNV